MMSSSEAAPIGPASGLTLPGVWILQCALRLRELGPLIDTEHALDLATNLRRAWPEYLPEVAAEVFLTPVDGTDAG